MSLIIDISTSLDGFIARPDDASGPIHEWYFTGDTAQPDNDFFQTAGASTDVVAENLATTGATITGRRTYDLTGGWDGHHPGGDAPVVVVSHSTPDKVPAGPTSFTFVDDIRQAIRQATAFARDKDVYVMGGASIIAQALETGLVDEIQVHVTPVILGEGVRLIDHLDREVRLRQTRIIEAPGVTHLRYQVLNE